MKWWLLKVVQQKNEDDTMYQERKNLYNIAVEKHNEMMQETYYDSGFDLYQPHLPEAMQTLQHLTTYKLGLGVQGAMYEIDNGLFGVRDWVNILGNLPMYLNNGKIYPLPYSIHPRSSIYKKSFRLANCTGIIDTGYRGNLGAVIDNNNELGTLPKEDRNKIVPHQRYFQVCAGDLRRFYVKLVNELPSTERGEGGFGSTGK